MVCWTQAWAFEHLFYLSLPSDSSSNTLESQLKNIQMHANAIDILGPQNYRLDEDGTLTGSVDQKLLDLAKAKKIKVMPLIVNINLNQEKFHRFLHNQKAQEKARIALLAECKKNNFYGLQFDFENISVDDKNEFTQFFQDTAALLHQNGFKISIAVVPALTDQGDSQIPYDRWKFKYWSGVYDNPILEKSADFISLMAYDLHTTLTTPGPIASIAWVEELIKNLLKKKIPANKISLGIPSYSEYWTTSTLGPDTIPEQYRYRARGIQIGYAKVLELVHQLKLSLTWSRQWKTPYAVFNNPEKNKYLNEYLFVEDARAFKAKLALAKRYHLRGISVWRIGTEDPKIWRLRQLLHTMKIERVQRWHPEHLHLED